MDRQGLHSLQAPAAAAEDLNQDETHDMHAPLPRAAATVAALTLLVLLVPAVAMQLSGEVNWGPGDFIAAGVLLFCAGMAYTIASRRAASTKQRALVADVHQPLHAGFFDDRGGNSYQLQAFDKGTNLHALWDSDLIGAWPGGLDALQAAVHAAPPVVTQGSPVSWAEQSCRIVSQASFYPDGRSLAPEYLPLWGPTLVQRLRAAGQRLATVLNHTLGEK